MIDCETHFGPTTATTLDQSYRLNSGVLSVSTAFVTQNPDQMKKSMRPVKTVPEPSRVHLGTPTTMQAALIRPAGSDLRGVDRRAGSRPSSMLGRYRRIFGPQALGSSCAPNSGISICRFHDRASRPRGWRPTTSWCSGLSGGTYGFPAEIADDPILDLVLPANERFEHAEERRLFYVALTRAKEHVYLIADRERPSVFAEELTEGRAGNPRGAVSVIGPPRIGPRLPWLPCRLRQEEANGGEDRGSVLRLFELPPLRLGIPAVCDACGRRLHRRHAALLERGLLRHLGCLPGVRRRRAPSTRGPARAVLRVLTLESDPAMRIYAYAAGEQAAAATARPR